MQKVLNKYLLIEFLLKDFDDNRGPAIWASKVSELDRRLPPSGWGCSVFLSKASQAGQSELYPAPTLSLFEFTLQSEAFKLQGS